MEVVLLLFSIIFLVTGVVFVALGGVYLGIVNSLIESVFEKYSGEFAVFVGGFLCITAIVGLIGSVLEKRNLLVSYAILLLLCYIIQLPLAVMAYIDIMRNEDYIRNGLKRHFLRYNSTPAEHAAVDQIQRKWQCCGAKGPQDFDTLPASCCDTPKNGYCAWQEAYTDGCTASARAIGAEMRAIAALAVLSGAFEFVLAGYAWYLSIQAAKRTRRLRSDGSSISHGLLPIHRSPMSSMYTYYRGDSQRPSMTSTVTHPPPLHPPHRNISIYE